MNMELKEDDLMREFRKNFYHPNYLSKMNISTKQVDISAIIPTYNRCPFNRDSKNYKYNPLYVCIKALLLQKAPIKEIVIVDDASTDNTEGVVKDLKKEAYSTRGVDIIFIKNKERKGSSISRNIGAKQAKGKYLFFLDDDCIPTPYLSYISVLVMKKLEGIDKHFAALVLPAYNRSTYPVVAVSIEELSSTFLKNHLGANLKAFPIEYLKLKDKFLNKSLKILKPVQVYQTWGHFVIDRKKYLDVGGFPDFATWPNKAGEEQEFACRLIENSYSLYYLPGTKAASYHGLYGAKTGESLKGDDWLAEITNEKLSLTKFSKICDEGIRSGNRVNVEEFCYSRIIAIFCIVYKRNIKEAINWTKKSYQEFVENAEKKWFIMYPKDKIISRKRREKIWHNALEDGLNLLINTERDRVDKLSRLINSFKVRGRIEEERESRIKQILDMIYGE